MRTAVARVVLAVAVTVSFALGLWMISLPVQVAYASGVTQSSLPSPVDPRWWGPCLFVGVVAAAGLARRRVDSPFAAGRLVFLGVVGAVGAVVAVLIAGPGPASDDESFLHQMQDVEGDDVIKLHAGEHACAWLIGQPWGQPPGAELPSDAIDVNVERYIEDQRLSNDTPVEAVQIAAADPAWRYLCEPQRWLHREMDFGVRISGGVGAEETPD